MIFFFNYFLLERPPFILRSDATENGKSPGGGLIRTIFKVFAPLRGVWGTVL